MQMSGAAIFSMCSSSLFLSGWYFKASFRYAFFTSPTLASVGSNLASKKINKPCRKSVSRNKGTRTAWQHCKSFTSWQWAMHVPWSPCCFVHTHPWPLPAHFCLPPIPCTVYPFTKWVALRMDPPVKWYAMRVQLPAKQQALKARADMWR